MSSSNFQVCFSLRVDFLSMLLAVEVLLFQTRFFSLPSPIKMIAAGAGLIPYAVGPTSLFFDLVCHKDSVLQLLLCVCCSDLIARAQKRAAVTSAAFAAGARAASVIAGKLPPRPWFANFSFASHFFNVSTARACRRSIVASALRQPVVQPRRDSAVRVQAVLGLQEAGALLIRVPAR
jgi:hypothetical protein